PLSRTAQTATINICDHVTRAFPALTQAVEELKRNPDQIPELVARIDNTKTSQRIFAFMRERLTKLEEEMLQKQKKA
ncbi:MAG: phosphopantothenate/pantothenate synthetase family protein, partial [Alphaproteobacteria bacterium]|nr:phosphopantothenate/pantothenate synthetase family protein [Alphaproteobacteria bacterium]